MNFYAYFDRLKEFPNKIRAKALLCYSDPYKISELKKMSNIRISYRLDSKKNENKELTLTSPTVAEKLCKNLIWRSMYIYLHTYIHTDMI